MQFQPVIKRGGMLHFGFRSKCPLAFFFYQKSVSTRNKLNYNRIIIDLIEINIIIFYCEYTLIFHPEIKVFVFLHSTKSCTEFQIKNEFKPKFTQEVEYVYALFCMIFCFSFLLN